MIFSTLGAVGLALAVMLGAFGAHALKERLDAYSIGIYERAVFYHFVHALGLLIVGVLVKSGALGEPIAKWVGILLCAGIVLFCGSLYVLAVTGVRTWGAVTPFGGLAFIAAWVLLAYGLMRKRS